MTDAACSSDEEAGASAVVVRGKPKSGRVWKKTQTKRHSSLRKGGAFHPGHRRKQALECELKAARTLAQELLDNRKQRKIANRERRELNRQRRIENERKSEIVQVIKNASKLKRIKKKQLRMIEKRDTNPPVAS